VSWAIGVLSGGVSAALTLAILTTFKRQKTVETVRGVHATLTRDAAAESELARAAQAAKTRLIAHGQRHAIELGRGAAIEYLSQEFGLTPARLASLERLARIVT
jgi:hypothetical protein